MHYIIITNLSYKVYVGLYTLLALFYVGLLSPPIKKGTYIKNRLIISIRLYSSKQTILTYSIYTPT